VPQAGQCLFNLVPAEASGMMQRLARESGDGWKVPPNPMPPDTPAADLAWATPRRRPQPIKTFATPLRSGAEPGQPRSYIYCTRIGPFDIFRPFAERAQRDGWRYFALDASHNPHITVPADLAAVLGKIAAA